MSNFSLLGCLELKLHIWGGRGSGDPNFFLQFSFSWVKMSFHVEFHLPGLPGSALKVFGGWWVGVEGDFSVKLWSKPSVLDQAEQQCFVLYSIACR